MENKIVIIGAGNIGKTTAAMVHNIELEVKESQSIFQPEPTLIKNYRFVESTYIKPINTNQKKFRKKNNRKHKYKRK
jgi:predicted dinucleotide-binding enzyme